MAFRQTIPLLIAHLSRYPVRNYVKISKTALQLAQKLLCINQYFEELLEGVDGKAWYEKYL